MTHRFLPSVLLVLSAAGCQRVEEPEAALARFYANDGPECTLKDPLFDAGSAVVPLVIEAISDPEMPRRRYAIAFLGEIGAAGAAGPLLSILENAREQDYFRADALQALQAVDADRARKAALRHVSAPGLLGATARDIGSGKIVGERRSGWARLWYPPCD